MARTKEFDPEKALEGAVEIFWKLGYEHASLDALMERMGIARQSLYDTFGDKHQLYIRALAHYRDGNHAYLRKLLGEGKSARKGFARILADLAGESRKEHERGCLLLSANLEMSAQDEEVRTFLQRNQQTVEEIFTDALKRARKTGEIGPEKDPATLARFFVATIQGMRALARLNHDRKALESIADVALASLD